MRVQGAIEFGAFEAFIFILMTAYILVASISDYMARPNRAKNKGSIRVATMCLLILWIDVIYQLIQNGVNIE